MIDAIKHAVVKHVHTEEYYMVIGGNLEHETAILRSLKDGSIIPDVGWSVLEYEDHKETVGSKTTHELTVLKIDICHNAEDVVMSREGMAEIIEKITDEIRYSDDENGEWEQGGDIKDIPIKVDWSIEFL